MSSNVKIIKEPRGWRDLPLAALPYKLSIEYKTGGWRVLRPIIDHNKCVKCLLCWLYCPELCIHWDGGKVSIDYDFCKGCGICAHECPVKAINMKPEASEGE